MHGHLDVNEFYQDISGFLVGYYLALAAMNALAAWFVWRRSSATVLCRCGRLCVTTVPLWLLTAGMFGLMSATAVGGDAAAIGRISLPQWSQKFLNVALQPTWYTLGTFAALGLLFLARRFFVRPAVAWAMLNLAFFFLGLSMTSSSGVRNLSASAKAAWLWQAKQPRVWNSTRPRSVPVAAGIPWPASGDRGSSTRLSRSESAVAVVPTDASAGSGA